jgi:hypothetical protein
MTDEQRELQNIAQQSMVQQPQEAPPVDMEAFNLLASVTNMETNDINRSHSEGNRESMITPVQGSGGIGGANPLNPLDNPQVMQAVIQEEMAKAQREVGNVQPQGVQPQQPVYQQPMQQQPVYQQPIHQPIQSQVVQPTQVMYAEGIVFPPNLQNIILTKIVAIEKTYAKIVEQQKDIMKQLQSNGS